MTIEQIAVTGGGAALIAALWVYFFGPRAARTAEVRNGVQEVHMEVKGGYVSDLIRVQQGVPVRLVIDRQEAGDCSARIVFPDFHVSRNLAANATTTLEFTPDRSGSFGFACGMNMLHGTLIVESAGGEAAAGVPAPGPAAPAARAVGVGPTLPTPPAGVCRVRCSPRWGRLPHLPGQRRTRPGARTGRRRGPGQLRQRQSPGGLRPCGDLAPAAGAGHRDLRIPGAPPPRGHDARDGGPGGRGTPC